LHVAAAVANVWTRVVTRGTPPAPRHFHNTVVANNNLYVFGGYDGHAWRNDVVALDLGEWRQREAVFPGAFARACFPRHATRRCCMSPLDCCAARDHPLSPRLCLRLRVLLPATKTWHNVISPSQDKPGARASGSACVISGNRVLVFGGYDGSEFLQDLWILHTGEQRCVPSVRGGLPGVLRRCRACSVAGLRLLFTARLVDCCW
jgi:hypothetical protein